MGRDYVPERDGDLKPWAENFAATIAGDPVRYGLRPAEAEAIVTAVEAFAGRLQTACNPGTRTGSAIVAKDDARAAMLRLLRSAARRIKNASDLPQPMKAQLGITVDANKTSPIAAPSSQPLLHVVECRPQRHILRFADAAVPEKRAKPSGALGLQVYYHVGDTPPADPLAWRFACLATRQPLRIDHAARDVGQKAHYIARWQTRRGKLGPWSCVAAMTVAG